MSPGSRVAAARVSTAVALLVAAALQAAQAADTPGARARDYTLDHVVRVDVSDPRQGGALVGFGAGILVGQTLSQVFIATANHVVRTADGRPLAAKVTLRAFGVGTVDAQVLAPFDAARDIAVLSIPAPPLEQLNLCGAQGLLLKSLRLATASMEPGASVMPLGHPNGRNWLSGLSAGPLVSWSADRIEFESSWLSPGHSGGALADASWALLGMVVRDSAPLGDALPVETLLRTLRDWGVPVTLATQDRDKRGSPWTFAQAAQLDQLLKDRNTEGLEQALRHCRRGHVLEVRTAALDVRKIWNLHPDHRDAPSLVWLAARENNAAALRVLLKAGVPANDRSGYEIRRPLQVAARMGHTEIIDLLLQAGARIDDTDHQGNTALHHAVLGRQWAAAQLLQARGANASLANQQGQTAADLAGADAHRLQAATGASPAAAAAEPGAAAVRP